MDWTLNKMDWITAKVDQIKIIIFFAHPY